jgi:hypothetical protein
VLSTPLLVDLIDPILQIVLFYLPLMHSENLCDQERCVRLMHERMPKAGASNLLHAKAHREVIRLFGRFPYRNDALFDDIIQHCLGDVKLCIARDITGAKEFIKTRPVREWKSQKPALHKIPTVFCLGN